MLVLKKIAITGGIASGKTTACHILEKHGAYVLYSDEIIHQLFKEDPSTKSSALELLGPDILTKKEIDRKKVADIVFNDNEKLRALEKLLHPKLLKRIDEIYHQVSHDKTYNLFVVEIPLIQEIGKEKTFDLVVAVTAKEAIAKERFKEKGFPEEMYNKRMQRQWNISKKKEHADHVIENNGTKQELEKHILRLIKEIHSK